MHESSLTALVHLFRQEFRGHQHRWVIFSPNRIPGIFLRREPKVRGHSMMSGVLNCEQIRQRIAKNELLVSRYHDANNVRRAAYDLRVGDDGIVVPGGGGDKNRLLAYPPGGACRTQNIVLAPGEVAFVASKER